MKQTIKSLSFIRAAVLPVALLIGATAAHACITVTQSDGSVWQNCSGQWTCIRHCSSLHAPSLPAGMEGALKHVSLTPQVRPSQPGNRQ